jgi:hypothetical protein
MHRVTAIQDPFDPLGVQSRATHDPLQAIPDPERPVRDERHRLGPRGAQTMKVHRQQSHQVVRPAHRAVDPGARPPEHPPLAVAEIEDQQLRLAPLDADLPAVLHAFAFLGLDPGADTDPPAIDLGHDVLSGHLLTRRELTGTEPLQVTGPCRQDRGTQLPGPAVDGLLIQGRPLVAEFVAGQLDRGEQGSQATHLTVEGWCGPLADPQGGQLGIGAGPFAPSPPTGPGSRRTGDRGDPNDQATQEPELQPPLLRGATGGIGPSGAPFFPGSAWSPGIAASARRLAVT